MRGISRADTPAREARRHAHRVVIRRRRVALGAASLALALGAVALALVVGSPPSRPPSANRRPGAVQGVAAATGPPDGGTAVDPGAFASGACVSFAPSGNDNHHTVFIDAGHGSIDPGGQGVTESGKVIYESGENLAIELDATALLRAEGFRVVDSRTKQTEVARLTTADLTGGILSVAGARADIAARDQCANMVHATLLVGIYLDAGGSPDNAGSITAYDATRPFAPKSKHLASLLQHDVLAKMNARGWQIPNDGVATDTTLGGTPLTTTAASYRHLLLLGPADPGWFTTPSEMPGALIEPLFVSDPFEGSIANSAIGHKVIAEGVAQAIEQYFATPG